jgi:hypothetical protein
MYLLFAGPNYYPGGGWEDFEDSFDTAAAAENFVNLNKDRLRDGMSGWYQIVDWGTKRIIIEGRLANEITH